MNWGKIGSLVADAAPIIGTALGGPAGAAVGGIVASALGSRPTPDDVEKAIKADPEAFAKLKQIELDHQKELVQMTLENETARAAETQKTMRAEISSEDPFVRRARPMFLYVAAFSVLVEVIIALIVVLDQPAQIGAMTTLFSALATPQSIALAACGIYLKKRSDDKAVAAGAAPAQGLLAGLIGKVSG